MAAVNVQNRVNGALSQLPAEATKSGVMTEKQQNVYESIMQYQRVNGYAPTIREICKMVGVASTSSVYAHLKILEEKGYIARKMDASRAIAIL